MQDLFEHSTVSLYNVTDIPYFEGDFWPYTIEETIKELDQEVKEREAEASSDVCKQLDGVLYIELCGCALVRVKHTALLQSTILSC